MGTEAVDERPGDGARVFGSVRARLAVVSGVVVLVSVVAVTAVTGGLVVAPRAPLAALAAAGLAWLVADRALRRVGAIERAYRELDAGAPGRLPEVLGSDELGRLTDALNGSLDRRRLAAERRLTFVDDAAEALRVPLGALRADLAAVASEGTAEAVSRARADLELFGVTAEEVLLLARLRAGERPDREILPWFEVMSAVRAPSVSAFAVEGDLATLVLGARTHLALMMQYALDEAARHARTAVTVRIGRIDDAVVLRVDDDGPPVPLADRESAPAPLGRPDPDGASGLALAVVDEIVRAHGGTVRLEESPHGGSRLRVELPAVAVGALPPG